MIAVKKQLVSDDTSDNSDGESENSSHHSSGVSRHPFWLQPLMWFFFMIHCCMYIVCVAFWCSATGVQGVLNFSNLTTFSFFCILLLCVVLILRSFFM